MVININKKISRILYHTSKTIKTGIPRIIKENVIYDIEIKLLHYDTHIITNQYILQNVIAFITYNMHMVQQKKTSPLFDQKE